MRLELKKRILQKVRFNRRKFGMELEHSLKKLNRKERRDLITWVKEEFSSKYPNIISRILKKESRRIRLGI